MAQKQHNPENMVAPFSAYAQGIEIGGSDRLLFVSGQLGVTPDGKSVVSDFESQCHQAFANIVAVLESAGMGVGNIVKLNAYLTRKADVPSYRAVRDAVLQGHLAASTVVTVAALTHPDLYVEIEAVAAG
jgi:2-iminobutanoate/2-iminopropanoate deaminase